MRRKCTSCASFVAKGKIYKTVPPECQYDGWCRYWQEDRDKGEYTCEFYKRRKMGQWKLYSVEDYDV